MPSSISLIHAAGKLLVLVIGNLSSCTLRLGYVGLSKEKSIR